MDACIGPALVALISPVQVVNAAALIRGLSELFPNVSAMTHSAIIVNTN
jgi:hypothetical protein